MKPPKHYLETLCKVLLAICIVSGLVAAGLSDAHAPFALFLAPLILCLACALLLFILLPFVV